MSSRKQTTPQDARGQPLAAGPVDSGDLPPARPAIRISKSVQPPFANMSLNTFIYGLSFIALLYLGVQMYRGYSVATDPTVAQQVA